MKSWLRKGLAGIAGFATMFPAMPVFAHEHGDTAAGTSGVTSFTINTGISSIVFVLLVLIAFVIQARENGTHVSKMMGMMAAMTVTMSSSLVIGTIAGILMNHLFYSTIIGVLFGMLAGYISGLSYSTLASMDGLLSGVMGGMMGAMLGVMVIAEYPAQSILFMDMILIISMSLLYKGIEQEVLSTRDISITLKED
ncbi:hypothetical protein [Paenibacillus sp. MMO-58]|uniref:hypothetical protein n=1 Tax=Paenibacillus sp. MMO-58 TaxID=3081290 RepID=UPI003017ED30